MNNTQLDAEIVTLDARRNEPRIKLVPFDKVTLGTERRYLVKGLIPYPGLSVVWGPPKSGKSFWTFDLVMHVALGHTGGAACIRGRQSIAASKVRPASGR